MIGPANGPIHVHSPVMPCSAAMRLSKCPHGESAVAILRVGFGFQMRGLPNSAKLLNDQTSEAPNITCDSSDVAVGLKGSWGIPKEPGLHVRSGSG